MRFPRGNAEDGEGVFDQSIIEDLNRSLGMSRITSRELQIMKTTVIE